MTNSPSSGRCRRSLTPPPPPPPSGTEPSQLCAPGAPGGQSDLLPLSVRPEVGRSRLSAALRRPVFSLIQETDRFLRLNTESRSGGPAAARRAHGGPSVPQRRWGNRQVNLI
ncbi:hypothetical protein VZT92_003289 [Zoarces viviparus]|uniref:Uncharacterized protein n=1 Tax=Zoarces viviparus TaxID=48416 RepID=A0AAW1G217_ZOAVI